MLAGANLTSVAPGRSPDFSPIADVLFAERRSGMTHHSLTHIKSLIIHWVRLPHRVVR